MFFSNLVNFSIGDVIYMPKIILFNIKFEPPVELRQGMNLGLLHMTLTRASS